MHSSFLGNWSEIDAQRLRDVLPREVEKNSVYFDLKRCPEKYVDATERICRALQVTLHPFQKVLGSVPCEA